MHKNYKNGQHPEIQKKQKLKKSQVFPILPPGLAPGLPCNLPWGLVGDAKDQLEMAQDWLRMAGCWLGIAVGWLGMEWFHYAWTRQRALLLPLGYKINEQGHFAMPQAYKNCHLLHQQINEIGHERASHGPPWADILWGRSHTLQYVFYMAPSPLRGYIWCISAWNGIWTSDLGPQRQKFA